MQVDHTAFNDWVCYDPPGRTRVVVSKRAPDCFKVYVMVHPWDDRECPACAICKDLLDALAAAADMLIQNNTTVV